MIRELSVENIALLDQVSLDLRPGFTVLTGETGAGKSLLIDAIGLALGGRADSDLVRQGATKGSVHFAVDLSDAPPGSALCQELGIDVEDDLVVIQREVHAEGRSSARINGKIVPLSTLRSLGALLVDLHGQHDHQALLDPSTHLGYLDAWVGPPASDLLVQVADAFADWERIRREMQASRMDEREREHRLDLLRFQIQEIEEVAPQPGEMDQIEADLRRLTHAEKLREAVQSSLATLADDEVTALDHLGQARKGLESALRLDPELESSVETLRQAQVYAEEAVRSLRAYLEPLDGDPVMLDQLSQRLDSLRRLIRKYGESEAAILEFLATARRELDQLENAESDAVRLAERLAEAESRFRSLAAELSRLRREGASSFTQRVQAEIRELAMEKALFEVSFASGAPAATGLDQVEFLFSANPGEPVRPLAKIASGGEISRVMLALKVSLAGKAGVPTLIFDEIDSGLSGRAAAVVAKKLEELARYAQVLVISHLPQIASRAEAHIRILKEEVAGRVATRLVPLSSEDRVLEIARMLAGEELGAKALENARELLRR
ncbi:MAG TPA: DNA repair protein RecN [Fimbriimonadaceae bacterium]|nr:DNA repair protein RecN [Fimbriimonadaceae bacterium]HRJ33159.1 DNA repair protein RecN [Fimbriimonadaceae bacterium]